MRPTDVGIQPREAGFQPADPFSNGSSRPEGRLLAGLPAPQRSAAEFVAQVAQTVRLIRSKGVGVFFVTQLPDDVPDAYPWAIAMRFRSDVSAFLLMPSTSSSLIPISS